MKFHRKPLSESSSAASASSASAAKAQPTAAARRTKAVAASVSSAIDEFDNQNDNRNHDDDNNQLQQTLQGKQILEEITDCTENGTLRNISACVNGSLQNGFALHLILCRTDFRTLFDGSLQGNIALLIRYRIGIVIGNGQLHILRGILWKNCCNLLLEYNRNRIPFGFFMLCQRCICNGFLCLCNRNLFILVIAVFKEIFCIQPTVRVFGFEDNRNQLLAVLFRSPLLHQ